MSAKVPAAQSSAATPQATRAPGPSLLEAGARVDPYELYRRLRAAEAPVRDAILGVQLVSRHAQVTSLLEHPSGRPTIGGTGIELEHLDAQGRARLSTIRRAMSSWLTFLPAADHLRRRRALAPAMPALSCPDLRRRVEALVDELLEQALAASSAGPAGPSSSRGPYCFDAVEQLAQPLPVLVIGEILGMPVEERHRLIGWSRDILTYFEIGNADPAATVEAMHRALDEMAEVVRVMIARPDPGADLIGRLVQDGTLSEDEIVATAVQLLFAGHETTRNLLGNGLWSLLRHDEALRSLRAEATLLRQAVEECLRYESPLQVSSRTFDHDTLIDGMKFAAGDTAILLLGAANRDPEVFEQPDRFDINRRERRHVAFGRGRHFCLGAALSRLEAEVLFARLFERFPRLELAGEVAWRPSFAFRGLERLPVRAWTTA